ncbi:MAG: hypothetical protein AB7O24_17925 [Kofleriaceae bacterium]
MSEPKPHRGLWQAQGRDIENRVDGGCSTKWEQDVAPTKEEGLALLAQLAAKCQHRERKLREEACRKAKRYVENAPPEGLEASGENKPFYVHPKSQKYKGARIDLDIKAGRAFTGPRR